MRAFLYAVAAFFVFGILIAAIIPLVAPPGTDFQAVGARLSRFIFVIVVPVAAVVGAYHQKAIDRRKQKNHPGSLPKQPQRPLTRTEPPPLPRREDS